MSETKVEFLHPGNPLRPDDIPEHMILVRAEFTDDHGRKFRLECCDSPEMFNAMGEEAMLKYHAADVERRARETPQ